MIDIVTDVYVWWPHNNTCMIHSLLFKATVLCIAFNGPVLIGAVKMFFQMTASMSAVTNSADFVIGPIPSLVNCLILLFLVVLSVPPSSYSSLQSSFSLTKRFRPMLVFFAVSIIIFLAAQSSQCSSYALVHVV